eukprot:4661183-Prymnesium_polylepis.1
MGTASSTQSVKVRVYDHDGGWTRDEYLGEATSTIGPGLMDSRWFAMTNLGRHNPGGGRIELRYSFAAPP